MNLNISAPIYLIEKEINKIMGYLSIFFCDKCGKQSMDTDYETHTCKEEDVKNYKLTLAEKKMKNK